MYEKDIDEWLFGKKKKSDGGLVEDMLEDQEEQRKGMSSGHGKLKKRKLSKRQQRELMEKGYTYVKVNGKRRKLRMDQTYDGGTAYKVYNRSDKPGYAIRDPKKDWKRVARHESSKQDEKPFEGDRHY